ERRAARSVARQPVFATARHARFGIDRPGDRKNGHERHQGNSATARHGGALTRRNHDGAGYDKPPTQTNAPGKRFTEYQHAEQNRKGDAQLVDWRPERPRPKLDSAV